MSYDHEQDLSLIEQFGVPYQVLEKPADYDRDIPYLRRTVALVNNYANSKPKGRESLLDQHAVAILRDPGVLLNIIDNLDLIDGLRPATDIPVIRTQLMERLEDATRKTRLSTWTPTRIHDLIRMGLDTRGSAVDAFEQLKAAVFNAPRTPEDAVDLFYNASWAMVETPQCDVREEIYSILSYEKDWLDAGSLSAFYFMLGSMYSDDIRLGKYYAIHDVMRKTGMFLETIGGETPLRPVRGIQSDLQLIEYADDMSEEEIVQRGNIVHRYAQRNPKRSDLMREYVVRKSGTTDLSEFYFKALASEKQPDATIFITDKTDIKKKVDERLAADASARNLPWPENLMNNPGEPLRRLGDRILDPQIMRIGWEQSFFTDSRKRKFVILTDRPIQIDDDLELRIAACDISSPEQKNSIVRLVHNAFINEDTSETLPQLAQSLRGMREGARVFSGALGAFDKDNSIRFALFKSISEEDLGRLASIIEFHRPILSVEDLEAINDQLINIRQEIEMNYSRSIGRRGYEMHITDPIIKDMGYESITFRGIDNDQTTASIKVAGQDYLVILDDNFRIMSGGDAKQFKNPLDQRWLELLVMSHLKKLVCTSESELEDELIGGEKQVTFYRKQVRGRIEHLKKLSAGRQFSTDAFLRCLASNLKKSLRNLAIVNSDRGNCTKETGQWTYERPVDIVDTSDAKPVKIAFRDGSQDIRAVIPLGEISQDELSRLEEEIFGDFEAA